MSFTEIEQQARLLPSDERVALVTALLDTLPLPGADVSDDEAIQRDDDLASGRVEVISQEEFARRVGRERGQ